MSHLTRQEQFVLAAVVALLLSGWLVRAYRQAHPAAVPVETAKP